MRVLVAFTCLSLSILMRASASEPVGWKPHAIKEGDGHGGWVERAAEFRFVHKKDGGYVVPFGLRQLDNGEVLRLGSWHDGKSEKPVVAFSTDRGNTWSEFQLVSRGPTTGAGGTGIAAGRPMMLTDLGKGRLTFQSD